MIRFVVAMACWIVGVVHHINNDHTQASVWFMGALILGFMD